MDDTRTFTPAEDITEPLKNGRGLAVVAHAGVAMPWARLILLGLVDGDGRPTVRGTIGQPDASTSGTLAATRRKGTGDAPPD